MGKKDVLLLLMILLAVWGLYLHMLPYDLIWDSIPLVRNNRLLQEPYPLTAAFTHGYWEMTGEKTSSHDYYRPLVTLSLMVEKKIWGLGTARLKATNLLIFSLSLLVLFAFFRRRLPSADTAVMATAIFALYPPHLDNIVWVVGRGDLLMLFWALLSLLLLDVAIEKNSWTLRLGSSLALLAGFFSKEACIFFLPFLVLHEAANRKRITPSYHLLNGIMAAAFWLSKTAVTGSANAPFRLLASFGQNVKAVLGVLGYYARSLLFPFRYDMFLPVDRVMTLPYVLGGAVAVLAVLLVLRRSRGKTEFLLPLLLLLGFVGGHLLLVFTAIYPFSISTRYLMVPAVALAWMIGGSLSRMKRGAAGILFALIIALSAPAIVVSGRMYRSEARFWERIYRAAPANSFLAYKFGQTFFLRGDYLKAETLLARALRFPMKRETAVSLGLLQSRIDWQKGDFAGALRWLDRIEALPLHPLQQLAVLDLRASIFLAQDQTVQAERLLEEGIVRFGRKELYGKLYQLHVGRCRWQAALEMERRIARQFPGPPPRPIVAELESRFASFSPEQKIGFFVRFGNYRPAIEILQSGPGRSVDQDFQLVRLLLRSGRLREGRAAAGEICRKYPSDPRVASRMGILFSAEFLQAEAALSCLETSLKLQPHQPEVLSLKNRLLQLKIERTDPDAPIAF